MSAKANRHSTRYGETKLGKMAGYRITEEEFKAMVKDRDRSSVIVTDAFLCTMLGHLIKAVSPREDEMPDKLLESHAFRYTTTRARLAYVLGLIKKQTMQDLEHITNIRNEWAHKDKPDLSNRKVRQNFEKLSTAKGQDITQDNYMSVCMKAVWKCMAILSDNLETLNKQK